MKTKLIFIRHGFSVANDAKYFAGHIDAPLTETGKSQAKMCAEYMKDWDIDAIYASDLSRAYDTAVPLSQVKNMPIIKENGLREICAGIWEGTPFLKLLETYPEQYSVWLNDIGNAQCPEGETVKELSARVISTVSRIAEENEGKTVCLATHATPIRAICTAAAGLEAEKMGQIKWVRNATINIFEYEDGVFTAILLDSTEHLGKYKTESPDSV